MKRLMVLAAILAVSGCCCPTKQGAAKGGSGLQIGAAIGDLRTGIENNYEVCAQDGCKSPLQLSQVTLTLAIDGSNGANLTVGTPSELPAQVSVGGSTSLTTANTVTLVFTNPCFVPASSFAELGKESTSKQAPNDPPPVVAKARKAAGGGATPPAGGGAGDAGQNSTSKSDGSPNSNSSSQGLVYNTHSKYCTDKLQSKATFEDDLQ
jgi:hypothetical protein